MRLKRTLWIALSILTLLPLAIALARPGAVEAQSPGGLLSAPDGTLFFYYGGTRHLADPATLAALGIAEHTTRVISQRTLEALPLGLPLPALRDGDLVADRDGRTFLVLKGLHPVPDEETFYANGWGGYKAFPELPVAVLDSALLAALPVRAPLDSARRTGPGRFEWGNCTWWVAQRRAVTWLGNGGEWYDNARAQGYAVGDLPLPGAILVRSSATNSYGHVAYVESVSGSSFTVSEMNVNGLGVLSTRTYDLAAGTPPGMIGFVYWRFGEEPPAPQPEIDDRSAEERLSPAALP